jgi:tetratricopeptide (TPR) repeat protein
MTQKIALQVYSDNKKYAEMLFFLFFIWLILGNSKVFSQDSIPDKKDLTEEKSLQFQEFFFKALSEKSIENYQKAIENLESCNQIIENQVAVFFEFSKNYDALNNTALAKEYIQRALQKEPENSWMLKHLVAICQRESNFSEAIKTQQKIAIINPKERENLVRLYFMNNQLKEALALVSILEKESVLSSEFVSLKNRLDNSKVPDVKEIKLDDLEGLKGQFENNKSYQILEKILQKSDDNIDDLLKFSKEGMTLFPEQSFVYLQYGKALISKNQFQKALNSLKNGLDFVIETSMEKEFYIEMAKAFKGLGNSIEEKKYEQKATNLKI